MENNFYEVAIGMIPGVGISHTRLLVSYCGSAENVFKETKGKLKKIPGIGEVLAETIANQKVLKEAEKEVERANQNNTSILFYTNHRFPERLKQIPDAPTLLYFKGNADLNAMKVIAVVGTRNATTYGKELTEKLLQDLITHDVLVVSGLAYGIDITAHKSALENGLKTIGVMGTGIDVIYPAVHREVASRMQESGGILTEYSFGTKPDAPHFPSRNRIIAGMADAVIVSEAAETGGALITAEIANSYNRDVFAFPGNIGSKYSSGCNFLIRNHKAHILTSAKDIEYIMNWSQDGQAKGFASLTKNKPSIDVSNFNKEEQDVLKVLLGNESILIDDLSWKSQVPVSKLASILLNLEFQGIVKSLPGKKFQVIA
jgi:DNA processing protein